MTTRLIRIGDQKRFRLLIRLVVNGILQAVAALGASHVMRLAFDRALARHRHGHSVSVSMPLLGLALVTAALVIAWLRMTERIDAERMGQDYGNQLRIRLFEHITTTSVRSLQKRSRGGMMLRFIGDLKVLRQWISMGLSRMVVAASSTSIAMLGLAWLNPWMAVSASVTILAGCAIGYAWGNHLHKAILEARRKQSIFAANVNEKISAIAVVQAFGQSERERKRMTEQGNELKDAMIFQAKASAQLRSIGDATASLASAVVLMAGAMEIHAGMTTAGAVVAAMSVVAMITPLLRDLSSSFVLWHGARVSNWKIRQFLENSAVIIEIPGAPELKSGPGALEFRNVAYGSVLQGISAKAQAGKRVALVGPNGSGKSTLLATAARLIDPDQGEILVDGQALGEHSLASSRRCMGMVSPDLPLLRGSLERNLKYRSPKASPEELSQVISLCGVDEIIRELPKGLATKISDSGSNLSLGQRQRIALARAILGAPSVLLLDEADSNLDPRSSRVLENVMRTYAGTIVMITHDYELVRTADILWYMEEGRLVEAGTPEEILGGSSRAADFFSLSRSFGSLGQPH